MSLKLKCSAEESVKDFKGRVYAAYKAADGGDPKDSAADSADKYCLKVVGRAAYFIEKDGDTDLRMGDYDFVSNAVEGSMAIDVRLEKLNFSKVTEVESLNPLTYKEKEYGSSAEANLLGDYMKSVEKVRGYHGPHGLDLHLRLGRPHSRENQNRRGLWPELQRVP